MSTFDFRPEATEADLADVADQQAELRWVGNDDESLRTAAAREADPVDAAAQREVVELDEDEYR